MYKLMVVDDEQIVIDAVKFIIEKGPEEVVVAAAARSGREALEKVDEIKPDIMLVDIQMPGINGLEVIREVQEHYKAVKFIIISAYEHFEFAQEAVNLGVVEYVLKPINRNRLLSAVGKAISEIEKDREIKKKQIENKEKLERVIPILEHGFIYSILLNNDFEAEIVRYKEIFDLSDPGGYIMVIEFGEGENVNALKNRIGSSIRSHSFYPFLRDTLKFKCKCVVGPAIINRVVVFVSTVEIENEYEQRIDSLNTAEYIVDKMKKVTDIEFFIGIGSYQSMENINYSYEEAIFALQDNHGERAIHIMDVAPDVKDIFAGVREKQKQLFKNIESGILDESLQLLNNITAMLNKIYYSSKETNHFKCEQVRNKWLELIVRIYGIASALGIEEDGMIRYNEYLSELLSINGYDLMVGWCKQKISHIVAKTRESKLEKLSSTVYNAIQYIDDNYARDVTLEEVSRVVGMSPQYFSRFFKERTGMNFIDYITDIRIEKAKELLNNTSKTVKEISYDVGYNDPNYFSRLFRKLVGVTPTEYIKNR